MAQTPAWPAGIQQSAEDIEIIVDGDGETGEDAGVDTKDLENGAIEIHYPDGSVVIDLFPDRKVPLASDGRFEFEENLAEKIDDSILAQISSELLLLIENDDRSRQSWLQARAKGIDLLGFKLEDPRADAGTSSAPLEGMSTTRDPILAEAVIRFQAKASGELLPAGGPVKVRVDGQDSLEGDDLAENLEKDLNHFLTVDATEYYPDTKRMLLMTGFGGVGFKKVYHSPLKQRPVSEGVDAEHLIVNNTATDLESAGRITHVITMRKSDMARMKWLGVYRDVSLSDPTPSPTVVDTKKASVTGIDINTRVPDDNDYTIYECYCEWDIPGYEHKEKGQATGLPLPYRITIDKTSQQILEIRRNWKEDDQAYKARKTFVSYHYLIGFGFYGLGLLHILGNMANALTAATRELIDSGMFASFPGFLYAQGVGRQLTNQFRVPPGGGLAIQTPANMSIKDAVMPLPYKQLDASFVQFIDGLRQNAARLGGTAETNVGESKQDAPVGTTLALIEQATKVEGEVFKGLLSSQSQELQLLRDLFEEDPEALWRANPKTKTYWDEQKFLTALDRCNLTPVADPNNPTHMHRMAKGAALMQMAGQAPDIYDPLKVHGYVLHLLGIDPEQVFAAPKPQQPPFVDPIKQGELQIKQGELDVKKTNQQLQIVKIQADVAQAEKERKSKEDVELLKLAQTLAVHPESEQIAQQFLSQAQQPLANDQAPMPPPNQGMPG